MKIGTTTIPFLPLAAVVLAMVLVVLVLWGVRRARRHPAPAAIPGARPARPPEPAQQPCAADWTGEVANGYVTPAVPAERPRTVADIVAERDADTSPLPVVAAASAAPPEPGSQTGAHALRIDPATRDAMAADDARAAPEASGTAEDATPSEATPGPATPDAAMPDAAMPDAAMPDAAMPDAAAAIDDPRRDVSAPSDERPDTATLAALYTQPGDVLGAPAQATPDDAAVTDEALPATAHDAVPPPWSAARSEPVGTGLEPSGGEPDQAAGAEQAAGAGEGGTGAEPPVSWAVQQALAARAVQRARRQRDDGAPDDASPVPEPAETSEQSREQPLTVLPSASPPVAAVDPRDRLLSVLLADPVRAVGATEDLDDARDRVDQLGDVLRRRRADLDAAVRRLHDSGLDRDQIGRLAGMGCDDVAAILEARTGDGADGPRHA